MTCKTAIDKKKKKKEKIKKKNIRKHITYDGIDTLYDLLFFFLQCQSYYLLKKYELQLRDVKLRGFTPAHKSF